MVETETDTSNAEGAWYGAQSGTLLYLWFSPSLGTLPSSAIIIPGNPPSQSGLAYGDHDLITGGTVSTTPFTTIPEPGTTATVLLGALGLIAAAWRRRRLTA